MRTALLLIALGLLAACTTVEDFHTMSGDERAQKVCTNSDGYRIRQKELQELNAMVSEKEQLLARGYRVHEQCRRVTAPPQKNDCENARNKDEYYACQEANARARTTTECIETPVQIDADYEYRLLSDYRERQAEASANQEESLGRCLERVSPLSPEEAWRLYEDDRDR